MLEESRMDKKSINRISQSQSRATAIDCKKSTELTHKPWPRNKKGREGSNTAQKNEPIRKNVPAQRGRGQIDKRCRIRGQNFTVGGTQNTRIENDTEPEIGSVYMPGSKKQNLNHLLNFMYPTRGGDRKGFIPRRQVHQSTYKHQHDLYLRAYCQFVVKEDGDYNANLADPDVPVKWEQIEEVIVRSTGRLECPICLGVPVAGRVGLCGHVYCWACVLHYANSHEKQPPPCPVCTASLQVKEMKPACMVQWESTAEEVTMRLVRRLRGSTTVEIAPPRGQLTRTMVEPIQPLENLKIAPYAKLFSATKEQIFQILERERKEIQYQILEEIDTTEIVYLEEALELLKLKEQYLSCEKKPPKDAELPDSIAPIVFEKQEINDKKMDWFDVSEEGAACIEILTEQMVTLTVDSHLNIETKNVDTTELNDNLPEEFPLTEFSPLDSEGIINEFHTFDEIDKENQAKYFYFYQADDGQQIFLNSLNVRILNASWGGLAAAPPIIKGRVLHRETLSLIEQTRKHMPYTAHLPLHCSFDIVEIDLQPPFVTDVALNSFAEELKRRAKIRASLERKERRRELQYRRAMEGPPRPDFSSELQFPPASSSYGSPPLLQSITTMEQVESSTVPLEIQDQMSPPAGSSSGLSFAKMASSSGTWRVRKTAPPTPPPPDVEEASAPRTLSLSEAIEAALQSTPSPTTKKNKKSKQKVLFATGMQRAA